MDKESTVDLPPSSYRSLIQRIKNTITRWYVPEQLLLIGTALLVGLATSIGAVLFRLTIKGVEWVGYTWFRQVSHSWGRAYAVILPSLGGLLVGLLIYYFAREAKGHGVPEVMEAIALRGGRIRARVALVKTLASGISIGSGGSVGREGPIVQIGSTIGSMIGQRLHLSDDRVRNLVACGAAAGIATTFNAPIAGVIFALEVILGHFGVQYFSSVVVASVVASVIGRLVYGNQPAFIIPIAYGINSIWEYAFYPLLGVLAALMGAFYTRVIYWVEDRFDDWKVTAEWVKPAVGGFLLGILALVYPLVTGVDWEGIPQIFNVGYDVIEAALANQLALKIVLVLMFLKLAATALTLGSGGSGGVFAPSLFIGAMLGSAFGSVISQVFPGLNIPVGAYALVGMAAVFSAAAHAPIAAVIFLFELTGDYHIILPLMLTVVIATFLSQLLLKGESIYTLKLSRRGVRLQAGRDIDLLQGVQVHEVMARQLNTVSKNTSLPEVAEIFAQKYLHSVLVLDDDGKLWGIITVSDLDRALEKGLRDSASAGQIATYNSLLITAYPDENMGEVLARMGTRGLTRAPVVSRDDPNHLLGMIRREDIIKAYNLGLARRQEIEHRRRDIQQHPEAGTEFMEITLTANDRAIGLSLAELAVELPEECILISIKRNGRSHVPHGNTRFAAGDQITVYIKSEHIETLFACFHGNQTK